MFKTPIYNDIGGNETSYCDTSQKGKEEILQFLGTQKISPKLKSVVDSFAADVNTVMLEKAIKYGVWRFKDLEKMRNTLKKDYNEDSEIELIEAVLRHDEKFDFSSNVAYKIPISVAALGFGLSSFSYSEGIANFFQSFQNVGLGGLVSMVLFSYTGISVINGYRKIEKNINTKTVGISEGRENMKQFQEIFHTFKRSGFTQFTQDNIAIFQEAYHNIRNIDDETVIRILSINLTQLKIQYNSTMFAYLLFLDPSLYSRKDNRILKAESGSGKNIGVIGTEKREGHNNQGSKNTEAALVHIEQLLEMGSYMVEFYGHNYQNLLEIRIKLQQALGIDISQESEYGEGNSLPNEIEEAYKILGIDIGLTAAEVNKARGKLAVELYKGIYGEEELKKKLQDINGAKDIIFSFLEKKS